MSGLHSPQFIEAARHVRLLGIDFDGVMTDNAVYVFEDGREAVRCSRFEGFGLEKLKRAGVEAIIVSTEKNPVVAARARKLKIDCLQDVGNKAQLMSGLLAERSLAWKEAAFIGNDINDLETLQRVGLPVVVSDAHDELRELPAFRTRRVGGAGAVRELCDAIVAAIEAQAGRERA
jgi:YrbI family 3-deoxy-D-manno-octulosonate 8-phosphate phosphatase